ncbi:MAG: glycoside hydrolase family 25 protein [Caulobacterales bacterium]
MSIAERPPRIRTLAVAAAALLAVFALVRWGPEIEVAVLGYQVTGVDVSAHQGPIDWPALAGSGAAFAYIKASEGGSHVDPRFKANWRGAKEAGLARGAYHFFTLCQPGLVQARHFLRTVDARGELPPAIDAEHMGPCRKGPTTDDPAREIMAFLDEVERVSGERAIVYTTRRFHDAHLKGQLGGEQFWIPSIGAPPQFRRDAWVFWQFDHSGRRPGVAGPIDLNVYRGSKRRLAAFLNDVAQRDDRSRATPPDP